MKFISMPLLFAFILGLSACNQAAGPKASLKSDEDKTFYSMGFMLGSNLQRLNLNDQEIANLYQGLNDAAKGKKEQVDLKTYQPKIQSLFQGRMKKASEKEKKTGQDFIADFMKKNPKAKKTDSGLVYLIEKEGTGAQPKETDTVEVHYHGTLITGEVFDSSVDRGEKITFPLNRVIKGWTEGLQLIKEGGKVKLVIPPELGYGDNGAPPKIPGGATLVFEVELFRVNPKDDEEKEKGKEKK